MFACARRIDLINEYSTENIIPIKLDITEKESIKNLEKQIENEKIDILINCAGGTCARGGRSFENYSSDELNYDFSLNVSGTVEVIKSVLSKMNPSENPLIITITSVAASNARMYDVSLPYFLAKSSESKLTDYLINTLNPIRITELVISTTNSFESEELDGKSLTTKDIFNFIKFLSESPSYLTIDKVHLRHINSGGAIA